MSNNIKRIDIKAFVEEGYLQELNRQFLHPLGLALEVVIEKDGTYHLGGVWDCRDDREGILYTDKTMAKPAALKKAQNVFCEMLEKAAAREEQFGHVIQRIPNFLDWVDELLEEPE
ncbi:MAG: hypothetical protein ACXABY_02875 [Candidatus Thorarchaeota archaeon]|jgi:hypothetical protein